jgi:hypothetical protein
LFRLALALGKTVGEIERTMSAYELREWMALSSLEPWGEVRADLRAAVIAREVRTMLSTGRKKYALLDFMPVVNAEIVKAERENANLLAAKINAFMFARPHVIINQRKA